MEVPELKKDEYIQDWLKSRKAKPNTQKGYLVCMQEFTEFTGMTPTELLEEAEAEIEARTIPRKQKIKQYLIGFREYLENKKIEGRNLAPLSVKNRMTGVQSFYKSFDIIIPILDRSEDTAKPLEVHKRIPDKEDIRAVLEICDPLEKAIILIGSALGLSINEICNLKIKDFKQDMTQKQALQLCNSEERKPLMILLRF